MEINQTPYDHEHASVSLKVILLVFAVVLIGALGYLVWAQNTAPDATDNSTTVVKTAAVDTTGWKTLNNTALNFSVKYPSTWIVSGEDSMSALTAPAPAWSDPTCNYEGGETCVSMVIGQDATAWTGTLASYVANYLALNDVTAATQSNITFGAQPAIKVVFPATTSGGLMYKIDVFTLHDKLPLMLQGEETTKTTSATNVTGFKNTAILNAIISSFQFTK